jgi:hypothetical protein
MARFWNALLGVSALSLTSKSASPGEARLTGLRDHPTLDFLAQRCADSPDYCDAMLALLHQYFPDNEFPTLSRDNSQFVELLFPLQQSFQLQTVSNGVDLIRSFSFAPSGLFCIYHFPVLFREPLLYFQTLIHLREQRHELWTLLTGTPSLLDAFFELHGSFVHLSSTPLRPEMWEYKLSLADVLFSLFRENSRFFAKAVSWAVRFIDLCIELIGHAPLGVAAVLLRNIMSLIRGGQPKIPKDQLSSSCGRLILVIDQKCPSLFQIALKFILSVRPPVLSPGRVIRMIAARGIRGMQDIEVISDLADGSSAVVALTFLSRSAISCKLWHRACMEQIGLLLCKFSSRVDVRDFTDIFMRRFFVFVALSAAKRRYSGRAALLCESLSTFISRKLMWLQPSLLSAAASVIASKSYPPPFKMFFPTSAPIDGLLVQEFEAYSAGDVNLKTFPFDDVKHVFIGPPQLDVVARVSTQTNLISKSALEIKASPRVLDRSGIQSQKSVRNEISVSLVPARYNMRNAIEPVIKRPAAFKHTRPLASAICVSPPHCRN